MQVEFDTSVDFTYVLTGIRELPEGPVSAREWLDAAAASGMPVDARLWLEGGPTTSYPACLAVKAAAEQGDPGPYLRAVREGLAFRRRRLDHAQAFESVARGLAGRLDLDRFRIDMGSHAIMEAFGEDLERGRGVRTPTIVFEGKDGVSHRVVGPSSWEDYRDAALAAGAASASEHPTIEEALTRFGSMAAAEVAAVCDLPGPRAPMELWRLAAQWRVKPEPTPGGEMWSVA